MTGVVGVAIGDVPQMKVRIALHPGLPSLSVIHALLGEPSPLRT